MEPPPPRPPRDAGDSASPSSDAAFIAPSGPFAAPVRRIATPAALASYAASPARADLLGFVRALAEAVRGVTLTEQVPESPGVAAVVGLLETLEARRSRAARATRQLTRRAGLGGGDPARHAGDALRQHGVPHVVRTRASCR